MVKTIRIFFVQDEIVWVHLFICSEDQTIKIDLSPVFNPFNDIIKFLKSILQREEIKIEIDEEGTIAELCATQFTKETFHFIAIKNDRKGTQYRIEDEYNIQEFVIEFTQKFSNFMKKDFDSAAWKEYNVHIKIEELDLLLRTVKKMNFTKTNGEKK